MKSDGWIGSETSRLGTLGTGSWQRDIRTRSEAKWQGSQGAQWRVSGRYTRVEAMGLWRSGKVLELKRLVTDWRESGLLESSESLWHSSHSALML